MAKSIVEGLPRLRARFERLIGELDDRVIPKELAEGAETFAGEVRDQAPVDTGALRDAIDVETTNDPGEHHAKVVVSGGQHDGTDRDHIVGFIEFGRLGQTPNPFIRRSFHEKMPIVKAQIKSGISTFIRRFGRK